MSIEFLDDRLLHEGKRPQTGLNQSIIYAIVFATGVTTGHLFHVLQKKQEAPVKPVPVATSANDRENVKPKYLSDLEGEENILDVPFVISGTLPDGSIQLFSVKIVGDGLSVCVDEKMFRFHQVQVGNETFKCAWLQSIALQGDVATVRSDKGIRISCSMGNVHVPEDAIGKIAVAGMGQQNPTVNNVPYTLQVDGILGTSLRALGMKEKDQCTLSFEDITPVRQVASTK